MLKRKRKMAFERFNELVFFRKSAATRALFGAVGVALASGKEVGRFSVEDIQSYSIVEKPFSNQLTLELKNGEYITFKLSDALSSELLPILEKTVVKRYRCRHCGKEVIKDCVFCPHCGKKTKYP